MSDEEVRQRIFAIPAFQENGAFIGDQRYQQLLRMQRPPLTPAEFEDGIRRSLTVEKLRALAHRLARRCPTRSSSRNTAAATTR